MPGVVGDGEGDAGKQDEDEEVVEVAVPAEGDDRNSWC